MSESIKADVLGRLSSGTAPQPTGQAKVRFGDQVVHVRFCSTSARSPDKFKFNINPNTLSADFELWICGAATPYYLLSRSVVHRMYSHPSAYNDGHHDNIRIVSVDTSRHVVMYARGGESLDLSPYLNRKLDPPANLTPFSGRTGKGFTHLTLAQGDRRHDEEDQQPMDQELQLHQEP